MKKILFSMVTLLIFLAVLVTLEIMVLNSTCSIFTGILGHYPLGILGMFFVAKERLSKALFLFSVLTVFPLGANSAFASSSEVARVLFGGKQTYHNYNNWDAHGHHDDSRRCDGYYGGHSGIDIQTTSKSTDEFYSVSKGKVIKAGGDKYNGIYVYDEDRKITAIYLHASQVLASNGQTVSVGQPLGKQGNTGVHKPEGAPSSWTGIHVHLEFRSGKQFKPACGKGTTIDPVATAMSYIKAQGSHLGAQPKPSSPQWGEGSLLRQQGRSEVYVIKDNRKYHIPNPQTLNILGYNWNQVKDVGSGVLGRILPGSPTLPSLRNGVLIKGSRPAVFVIQGGRKCWIPDPATFKAKGYNWNQIKVIPDWALDRIPRGPDVRR